MSTGKSITTASLIIALILALTILIDPSRHALAAGQRFLTLSDMGDFNFAEGANNNAISGATYKYGTLLAGNNAYVTLFTHKFPGYAAFTAAVGVEDGSVDNHPGTAILSVTVDGKLVKTITKSYGQAATTLTVPFGQASQIKLTLHENQKKDLYMLLGNPAVVTRVPKPVATPPAFGSGSGAGNGGGVGGTTTLRLSAASAASGSQETALITTGANAMFTVVITYPGGTQQVLGPKKAGADGHFAYSWVVPSGVAGVARVVVVSGGVAQATFTIQ
ncbi:MAG: NPCBM/NEW2 domain-containing protein [Chloroflexota bacterium]